MIKINLLSPLDKETLKWEKINNLVTKSIVWILTAEAIFVGVFLFTVEYLKAEKESAEIQFTNVTGQPQTQEVAAMEADLQANKIKINDIASLQKDHLYWSVLFEDIANMTPVGVRLKNISVSEDIAAAVGNTGQDGAVAAKAKAKASAGKMKVEIEGNAKTRDNLLSFEDSLKKSTIFSNLEYDDANYVQSSDIDFKYAVYVSSDKLLK